ncbi:complement resistance protein TraT [Burkholderia ubonensis]|uniref:complement resistance protein TraT n=2 Tax=Burkholderia ubonensis TaxID=101571 RepID=UPI000B145A07|nr:complement resistance protein TraT [Burkholderia ubonensis]
MTIRAVGEPAFVCSPIHYLKRGISMRELTTMELDHVAGAGFWSSMGAGFLGALTGFATGFFKGGVTGGSTGGIVGAGIISAGVGAIAGAIVGLVGGAIYGLMNDWAPTASWFNENMNSLLDPTYPALK